MLIRHLKSRSRLSQIVKVIFAASPGERFAFARNESKIEFGTRVTSSRPRRSLRAFVMGTYMSRSLSTHTRALNPHRYLTFRLE